MRLVGSHRKLHFSPESLAFPGHWAARGLRGLPALAAQGRPGPADVIRDGRTADSAGRRATAGRANGLVGTTGAARIGGRGTVGAQRRLGKPIGKRPTEKRWRHEKPAMMWRPPTSSSRRQTTATRPRPMNWLWPIRTVRGARSITRPPTSGSVSPRRVTNRARFT